jgi:hypothetical protein
MNLIKHETKQRLRRRPMPTGCTSRPTNWPGITRSSFSRQGLRYRVAVPDEVTFSLEVEINAKSEIEIER